MTIVMMVVVLTAVVAANRHGDEAVSESLHLISKLEA